MSKLAKALTAAAGNAGGEALYVEDVFSTDLYTGTGSAQTITNGIDLDGEGGLVWNKLRDFGSITNSGYYNHWLTDTARGAGRTALNSNTTDAAGDSAVDNVISSFNSDGFTLSSIGSVASGSTGVSWTFRKAEKFFDVVTYTGDGSGDRVISHSLNSTPASIIMKKRSATSDWPVYHTGAGTGAFEALALNQTSATGGILNMVVGTSSSSFTVRSSFNDSGTTYVAYLFASDAGGFGDDGSESIIKCGSFSGGIQDVDLGFEPQFLIYKRTDSTGGWAIFDVMRGMTADGVGEYLQANTSDAEASGGSQPSPIANGFRWNYSPTGETYIYIAIRRPMKTPESGTEVFSPFIYTGNNVGGRELGSLSGADSILAGCRNTFDSIYPNWQSKLQGNSTRLVTSDNGSEYTSPSFCYSFGNIQDGVTVSGSDMNGSGKTYVAYEFKRATGFFDVVAYTGTGSSGTTESHNLGTIPQLIIAKPRSASGEWVVLCAGASGTFSDSYTGLSINSSNAALFNGDLDYSSYHTSEYISPYRMLGATGSHVSSSGTTYIAYLFATLDGVSKVGSYTGDGTTDGSNVIDCGFSAGARFVLIKRTDSTGNWIYMDSVRGITSSNDPILKLNSGGTEQLGNSVHPAASGFGVVEAGGSNANTNNANYIFLAIA